MRAKRGQEAPCREVGRKAETRRPARPRRAAANVTAGRASGHGRKWETEDKLSRARDMGTNMWSGAGQRKRRGKAPRMRPS